MKTKRLAVYAIITALLFVTALLPFVFLLPVTVAAALFGKRAGLFSSLAFGCISLMYAYTLGGASPVSLIFIQYPFIAVVPRLAVGPAGAAVFSGASKIIKNKAVPIGLSALAASLTNTVLVVGCFYIFARGFTDGNGRTLNQIIISFVLVSAAIEAVAAAALTPPIVLAVRKACNFDKRPL